MELTRPEQDAQIHRPHKRQWCLRRRHPKLRPHLIQELVFPSGIHIAGTQCSTFRLLSAEWPRFSLSFFLPFPLGLNETLATSKLLQLARKVLSRSSDGGKGRACKDRRMWFVDDEEVKVELGLVTFKETNNWVLAPLISEVQSSLSSSVAEMAINFNF